MSFELPVMYDNQAGWGPPKTDAGLPFDIPYQQFFKGERIGNIVYGKGRGGRGGGKGFIDLPQDDDEKNWTTADYHKQPTRGRPFRARGRWGGNARGGMNRRPGGGRGGGLGMKPKKRGEQNGGYSRGRRDVHRSASIEVKGEWDLRCTLALNDLAKLNDLPQTLMPQQGEVLAEEGEAMWWNGYFDKVNTRNTVDIMDMKRSLENCSVVESKQIRDICSKLMKEAGTDVQVYATDCVLATLMAAPKSSLAWDISVERLGNAYFLDWRKGTAVDTWTVGETGQEQFPMEESQNANEEQKINIQPRLMREMAGLTVNFSQQTQDRKKPVTGKSQVKPAPVPEQCEDLGTRPASVIYRYRQWELRKAREADPTIKVVARTQADGYLDRAKCFYRAFVLNDLTACTFRPKLQRNEEGAVTAPEIINNGTRLAKQACVSHLAGCEKIKLGFVSRKKCDKNNAHTLLHTATYEPKDIVKHVGMSFKGMWNVLTRILTELDKCKNEEPSQKFVLMKDPNKPLLKLYDVSAAGDASSEDDDDEEEEEEESEEDEE